MAVADPDAVAHLRAADRVMREIIDEVGVDWLAVPREDMPGDEDHYGALVRAIIGQQVSTASARAIYFRLCARFGGRPPSPAEVLADDPDELRTAAGLSRPKLAYLVSLAEHVEAGALRVDDLDGMPDEEVIHELVAVKGIGTWSAHVYLIFHMQRPDVVAVGDLAIRKVVMRRYGLPRLPEPEELVRLAEPWRPYRTLACRFLWRSFAATPVI